MATSRYQSSDLRRQVGSPRPKGRENKETPCRNVLIYGHCRYEDQGCTFSHDSNKSNTNSSQQDAMKKSLNVDSPSFTPAGLHTVGKKAALSTQAATFTPKGLGAASPNSTPETEPAVFNPATIREFTPSFDVSAHDAHLYYVDALLITTRPLRGSPLRMAQFHMILSPCPP
jgi:PAB-dependent poly(A)-specific ribonuclease subunit 3